MNESFSRNFENEILSKEIIKEALCNLSLDGLEDKIENKKADPKDRLLNHPKVGLTLTKEEKAFIKKIASERGADFKEGFKRMEPYLDFLYKECINQEILFEFALIPLIESHFIKKAVSRSGAKGPWQFTDGTAKNYNLDNPFDVKSSSKAGIKMCKKNYQKIKELNPNNSTENIFKFSTLAYNTGLNKTKALYDFSKGDFPFLISKLKTKEGLAEINKFIKQTNSSRKYKLSAISLNKSIEISRYVYKIFAARNVLKNINENEHLKNNNKLTYKVEAKNTVFSIFKDFGIKNSEENYIKFKKLNNTNTLNLNIGDEIILPIKVEYLNKGKGLYNLINTNKFKISAKELFDYNESKNPYFKNIKNIDSIKSKTPIFIPDNLKLNSTEPQKVTPQKKKPEAISGIKMEKINPFSGMTYSEIKENIKSMPKISNKLKGHLFIIDPGHGGGDPGAVPKVKDGNGNLQEISEAPLVYDISLRLMEKLIRNGATVYFTSYSDDIGIYDNKYAIDFPTNKERKYNLTNKKVRGTADLLQRPIIAKKIDKMYGKGKKSTFVSIHADSKNPKSKGIEILYGANLKYKAYDKSSKKLSDELAKNINAVSKTPPYNPKTKGPRQLGVLKHNENDNAILIEVANMRNENEAFKLRSSVYREKLSKTLADGFIKSMQK